MLLINRWIDLFGDSELIALDVLSETAKTLGHQKNTGLSSQVPHKSGEIDKGFHDEGCADRKMCCPSPVYRLWD